MEKALEFHIEAEVNSRARAATVLLPHGPVLTPVFMPVGTKGSIKGLSSQQLQNSKLPPQIILGNTYHLGNQPGTDVIKEFGGLHEFMNWKANLLTDSGGFQMVSLLKLAEITEEGVQFQSPVDGSLMMLTPERSIQFQNDIGADIIMQLDDVVSSVTDSSQRFAEATARSVRWLDRCIKAHARPKEQNLFAIIQGGLDISPGGLREQCLEQMIQRDLPGYAIGGLAGGEDKESFWKVVAHNASLLPRDKPRYLMGVGYPLDLVVCVALGVDMFDCVYPTRTARFGVALVPSGTMRLKAKAFSCDLRPLDAGCDCIVCGSENGSGRPRYSRAFLHTAFKENAPIAAQLLTSHNIAYMMRLMRSMRESILKGPEAFEAFVRRFLVDLFSVTASSIDVMKATADTGEGSRPEEGRQVDAGLRIPSWVVDALAAASIDVRDMLHPSAAFEEEPTPKHARLEAEDTIEKTKNGM